MTLAQHGAAEPLPGYKDVKPMVFAGLFPTEYNEYSETARRAGEAEAQRCRAFVPAGDRRRRSGFGFRCGFLGLLHMEIVRERLEREYDLDLLITAPNVAYRGA